MKKKRARNLENKEGGGGRKRQKNGDGGGRWERAEEEGNKKQRLARDGYAVSHYVRYRFFFALALTLLSNTVLRIGVCAVWNGFIAVCLSLNTYLETKR